MCRKPKNLVFCPLWGWKRQKIPLGRVLQRCIFKKTEFGRVLQRCILTLSQVFYLLQRCILTLTEVFQQLQRYISTKTQIDDILSHYIPPKIQSCNLQQSNRKRSWSRVTRNEFGVWSIEFGVWHTDGCKLIAHWIQVRSTVLFVVMNWKKEFRNSVPKSTLINKIKFAALQLPFLCVNHCYQKFAATQLKKFLVWSF